MPLFDQTGNLIVNQPQPGTVTNITIDQTTINVDGLTGVTEIELTGSTTVKVAIADYLETLYNQLLTILKNT